MRRKTILTLVMGLTCSALMMGCNNNDGNDNNKQIEQDDKQKNDIEDAKDSEATGDTTETDVQRISEDSTEWKNAYTEVVNKSSAEDKEYKYSLCYVDEDEIPELVVDKPGYYVSVYTYADDTVFTVCEKEPYGTGSCVMYNYEPYKNVIGYYSHNASGSFEGYFYYMIDSNKELTESYVIFSEYVDDNGDQLDNIEAGGVWEYTYGTNDEGGSACEETITEDEYSSKIKDLPFDLVGNYSATEILDQLK